MLIKINYLKALDIAKRLEKETILSNPKNKKDKITMLNFFILEYCTENEQDSYYFYTNFEQTALLCMCRKTPSNISLSKYYCYIECIVNCSNKKDYKFDYFLQDIEKKYSKKIALSASTKKLVEYYKKFNFKLIGKNKEDWSSLGYSDERTVYVMRT